MVRHGEIEQNIGYIDFVARHAQFDTGFQILTALEGQGQDDDYCEYPKTFL